MDFVEPLPEDGGYNMLLTISDRLGSDVRLVATHSNDTAKQMAAIFFDEWFYENGMPIEIFCDRDKLWTSKFWRALQKMSGVRLALSFVFHPQTNGLSERTNKTVIQALRYYVNR